jgi:GT2 family glycosyltransferase
MPQLPSVDVVVLSWNRIDETIAAIESALVQQGVERRVYVVDQGSSPENLAQLRAFMARQPEVVLRELGRNVGVAMGRNIATQMGGAPYVVALDNDAIFYDEHVLARTVQRFEDDGRLGAIAFRILNYFTGHDDDVSWDYPAALRPQSDQEFFVTRFVGAGYAVRRSAFDATGGYDASLFFGGEERDLSYRILNLGYYIKYLPELTVRHRVDPEARIQWSRGRYYYAVRNTLYIEYKYGTPWLRLGRAAAALAVKGVYNGLTWQTLRGLADAATMAARSSMMRASGLYRLTDDVKAYIERCERVVPETLWGRTRRQFTKLPGNT